MIQKAIVQYLVHFPLSPTNAYWRQFSRDAQGSDVLESSAGDLARRRHPDDLSRIRLVCVHGVLVVAIVCGGIRVHLLKNAEQ